MLLFGPRVELHAFLVAEKRSEQLSAISYTEYRRRLILSCGLRIVQTSVEVFLFDLMLLANFLTQFTSIWIFASK